MRTEFRMEKRVNYIVNYITSGLAVTPASASLVFLVWSNAC